MKWVRWLCRIMYGAQARFFADEIFPTLRHKKKGLVSMAGGGKDMNASQFFITTGTDLDSLDEKHTIFGEVYLLLMQLMAGAQASLRLELCLECIAGPMFTLIWQMYLDCHFRCRLSCFWIHKLSICRVKTTYFSIRASSVYAPWLLHAPCECEAVHEWDRDSEGDRRLWWARGNQQCFCGWQQSAPSEYQNQAYHHPWGSIPWSVSACWPHTWEISWAWVC